MSELSLNVSLPLPAPLAFEGNALTVDPIATTEQRIDHFQDFGKALVSKIYFQSAIGQTVVREAYFYMKGLH